jgi:fumarate reductase subunit C
VTAVQGYRRPVSTWWWLRKRSYLVFVLRELSSIFVAWFVVFLLVMITAVGRGRSSFEGFLDFASSPVVVAINVVASAFLVLHVVTWFALTPQAMVLRVGGRRVPGSWILASQYAGLAVVSAFVVWVVTR